MPAPWCRRTSKREHVDRTSGADERLGLAADARVLLVVRVGEHGHAADAPRPLRQSEWRRARDGRGGGAGVHHFYRIKSSVAERTGQRRDGRGSGATDGAERR